MSAERLREAAALMRSRAKVASGSPWVAFRANDRSPSGEPWFGVTRDLAVDYDPDIFSSQRCTAHDAEHIASWHPVVALAVAYWLDVEADVIDEMVALNPDYELRPNDEALAVANAYLGATS